MAWVKVGEVVHYFGNIDVAIIELEDELEIGDWIGFVRHEELVFEQEVTSMQIEYQTIELAEAGDSIGLQVVEPAKVGSEVYKKE